MLTGDERDGVGDSDLPDEQDFELVECAYVQLETGKTKYCIPFNSVSYMAKVEGRLLIYIGGNPQELRFSEKNADINSIWQSWLVYCGHKIKPMEVF